MASSQRSRWILIVLAVFTVASLWRTFAVERDKRAISAQYTQAQQLAAQLSSERDQLTQELTQAKQEIQGQTGEMDNLKQELTGMQEQLDQTIGQLSSMQREHEALRQEHTSMAAQLESVTEEREALAAKLSSLKELRVAIHDVKQKIRDERWAAWYAHVEESKRADLDALASGNRGYVTHNGATTLGARPGTPRMNVHVLEPQTQ